MTFNGANPQSLNLNLGSQTSTGGTGLDGTTQFGSTSAVASQSQDGYASGALSGVQIGADGTVSGVYTNGQTIAVAQLAVAKFQSNDGLASAGQNVWAATTQSGAAALGAAGSGGRGGIAAGALGAVQRRHLLPVRRPHRAPAGLSGQLQDHPDRRPDAAESDADRAVASEPGHERRQEDSRGAAHRVEVVARARSWASCCQRSSRAPPRSAAPSSPAVTRRRRLPLPSTWRRSRRARRCHSSRFC